LILVTLKWLSHNHAILSMSKKGRHSNSCNIHNTGLLYTKICYINALSFVNVTATERNMQAFISYSTAHALTDTVYSFQLKSLKNIQRMCIMQCCNFKTVQEIITKKLTSYMKRGFATLQGKEGVD